MLSSFSTTTKTDGLGGAKNLRGILRNRVVGDGVAWGNVEFRWRITDFIIAVDYGIAMDHKDGVRGLYIVSVNLF
jgi:hypothetical protein